ncbi:50S ribosomal protein L9 [Prosthecomicrobium pneumaticum]|uniref:Large ribosomal subunit protein bL9 n=1 Tax=Prosthecomicrobium pneumaticum TaxID=81895 RepID=A0A7W9FKV6_9HYPH|nr:50S ribosomal protein L9 [Prosthecomicrobium pneumaticum]MBB5751499.1 large subunit ribosomal protein L9 [Prosthecomicrobium pneumaticum]
MEVILLERVAKLGQMGEVVRVRDGFARNFLLPQGKALRATEANRKRFENERHHLEARNLERKKDADKVAAALKGASFVVVRQAGETGQLYGSVSSRDLAEIMAGEGFSVARNQVVLEQPIKTIGLHSVVISLHPEVEIAVTVNVARSADEATRQARGEDLTQRETFELEPLAEEDTLALGDDEEI